METLLSNSTHLSEKQNSISFESKALPFIKHGIPVFPVHYMKNEICSCGKADCKQAAKHPLTQNGFKDATLLPDKIKEWSKLYPDANLGIPTGQISGFWVLDVDKKNDGLDSFNILKNEFGDLLQTYSVQTGGGGYHLFFRYPANKTISSKTNVLKGIDVRADGGYIVGPNSIHVSGAKYVPLNEDFDFKLLKHAPEILIEKIKKSSLREVRKDDVKILIPEGQRNDFLFRLSTRLFKEGLSYDAVMSAIQIENRCRANPPLENLEVVACVESASKYDCQIIEKPIMGQDAFYGVAGLIINKLLPETEASKESMLVQLLVTMGAFVGRRSYLMISGTHHYLNEFAVVIGSTSKGRKGTSFDTIKYVMEKRLTSFFKDNVK